MDYSAAEPANENAPPDQAAHLDGFRAADLDAGEAGADQVQEVGADGEPVAGDPVEPEQLSREAFYTVFYNAFGLPGMFAADFAPLAIQPGEEPPARAASDAIYELLEIYYPKALLPMGDTLARLFAIVPFAMVKAAVVRDILRARAEARREAAREAAQARARAGQAAHVPQEAGPPPANDNAAPPGAHGAVAWMGDGAAA